MAGPTIMDRLKHGFNAFAKPDDEDVLSFAGYGEISSGGVRPDRVRYNVANDRSIVTSIYTRIAIDFATVDVKHVKMDVNGRYIQTISSPLNNCLTLEANLDQAARAFRMDIALTLFEEGVAVIVPVETSIDPAKSASYDIHTMRVGRVVKWHPKHVRVRLYNEATGRDEELTLLKSTVGIVENPLYNVMNEPNSTLKRLVRKLALIDSVDEQSSSGKLDLIIQLPYTIRSQARKEQAQQRREEIETQMKNSKYGIAYADGIERITQLNRPAENNMLKQVEYLQAQLYGQLGITSDVFDGTASAAIMLNYHNRTIEPLLAAVTQEMKRKFLTKTARTQGQSVEFYRDPFKLVTIESIAEITDKMTRNEVMTSNEIRGVLGMMPSDDKNADVLRNKNLPEKTEGDPAPVTTTTEGKLQNGS